MEQLALIASAKCWGFNLWGQLGQGDTIARGDGPNEMGDALPPIDLGQGVTVARVACGGGHVCALLDGGSVKCWGPNSGGELGLGDHERRGDGPGEMGDALPTVDLGQGEFAVDLALGSGYSCAVLGDGAVKCWGWNDSGQLGLGDTENRGDDPDEMGDALPPVDLGTGRTATALGIDRTLFPKSCAWLDDGPIKCWGYNETGDLGLGDTENRGDEPGEMGDALPTLKLFSANW